MPYIKEENRPKMNEIVDKMIGLRVDDQDLSLVLYGFCKNHIEPSYNNYKNYFGELNEVVAELQRRYQIEAEYGVAIKWVMPESRMLELANVVELMFKNEVKVNGDLNYTIFKYVRGLEDDSLSADCATIILSVVDVLRKNLMADYEDAKILENGDV